MELNSKEKEEVYSPFADLFPGVERLTKVMVCQRRDASNMAGKCISTEFILSDFRAAIGVDGDKFEEEDDYLASENTNEAALSSVLHTVEDETVEGVEDKLSNPSTPLTTPKKARKLDVVTSTKED